MAMCTSDEQHSAATALYVAFGVTELDLCWIPDQAPVVVVHNDDLLDEARTLHEPVAHVYPGRNLGFGQGVMSGLEHVTTPRVVLCNPDVTLQPEHWAALAGGSTHEVCTVPLVDASGRPTVVTSPYPGPAVTLLTAMHAGRLAPRGGALRSVASWLLGSWGADHRQGLTCATGVWPLQRRWVSGAAVAFDVSLLRTEPFDPKFFLYFEDVDLCARMAARFPGMVAKVAPTQPGRHAVGGSAHDIATSQLATRARWESAHRYASDRTGWSWCVSTALLGMGCRFLGTAHGGPDRHRMPPTKGIQPAVKLR